MNHQFLSNCVKIRRWYKEYKSHKKCVLCGATENIEFHHLWHKKMKVSAMVRHATTLKALKDELDKCIPLCGTCHKVAHRGIPMQTTGFLGITDKIIVSKIQDLETDFMNGKVSIDSLRTELGEFHKMAKNADLKKAILMEYDGLEINATRSVT